MSNGQSARFSDVAEVYDQLSEFFTTILSGSIHSVTGPRATCSATTPWSPRLNG